jgi:hypothetical protein
MRLEHPQQALHLEVFTKLNFGKYLKKTRFNKHSIIFLFCLLLEFHPKFDLQIP